LVNLLYSSGFIFNLLKFKFYALKSRADAALINCREFRNLKHTFGQFTINITRICYITLEFQFPNRYFFYSTYFFSLDCLRFSKFLELYHVKRKQYSKKNTSCALGRLLIYIYIQILLSLYLTTIQGVKKLMRYLIYFVVYLLFRKKTNRLLRLLENHKKDKKKITLITH